MLSTSPGTASGRVAQASPAPQLNRQNDGREVDYDAIFCYYGTPYVNEESPPYYNRIANGDVGSVSVSTRATTSASTTVQVLVNGSSIGSVTLPAGASKSDEGTLDYRLNYGDQVTVRCTSVGTGLVGLTVQVSIGE